MVQDTWPVGEAKARFSELLDRVTRDGPLTITRAGSPAAVLVSTTEWTPQRRNRTAWCTRPRGLQLADAHLDALFLRDHGAPEAAYRLADQQAAAPEAGGDAAEDRA